MKLKKYNLSFLKTSVFLVQALLLVSVFVFSAETVNALTQFKPQVTIPGSTQFEEGKSFPVSGTAIAEFIKAWYEFAIAAIGILATVMIMAGGLIWLTAGGNASQVSKAKDWITGAVIGVFLALGSYTLLELLNPDLVTLKSIEVSSISDSDALGMCCYTDKTSTGSIGEKDCPVKKVAGEDEKGMYCASGKECGISNDGGEAACVDFITGDVCKNNSVGIWWSGDCALSGSNFVRDSSALACLKIGAGTAGQVCCCPKK